MQVVKLAHDTSIVEAIQAFNERFVQLEAGMRDTVAADQVERDLAAFYENEFAGRLSREISISDYLPESYAARLAQWIYIVKNLNPVGKKGAGYLPVIATAYQLTHARFHGQLNRYLQSFGSMMYFYSITMQGWFIRPKKRLTL